MMDLPFCRQGLPLHRLRACSKAEIQFLSLLYSPFLKIEMSIFQNTRRMCPIVHLQIFPVLWLTEIRSSTEQYPIPSPTSRACICSYCWKLVMSEHTDSRNIAQGTSRRSGLIPHFCTSGMRPEHNLRSPKNRGMHTLSTISLLTHTRTNHSSLWPNTLQKSSHIASSVDGSSQSTHCKCLTSMFCSQLDKEYSRFPHL